MIVYLSIFCITYIIIEDYSEFYLYKYIFDKYFW